MTQVIHSLQLALENALAAAEQARLAATDDQSVAETQYDTLSIEAGFLAHGHSQRAHELKLAINTMEKLKQVNRQSEIVEMGSLVTLVDAQDDSIKYYLIAPFGGGNTIEENNEQVIVITPKAPLSEILIGKSVDDEVLLPSKEQPRLFFIEKID